jgi:hypothetical protein
MTDIGHISRHHFVKLSLQYYVTGRFAVLNQLHSAAPTLLHHAVELILKAALAATQSLTDLKQHGHGLSSLWQAALQEKSTLKTPSCDATIADLDKFEDLRYPDKLVSQGASVSIGIRSGENPVSSGSRPSSGPSYRFNLGDIDELWAAVFKSIPANPAAFLQGLSEDAHKTLVAENQHPIALHLP